MPPHLHPRSRSTTSLFTATLLASFLIVGMPHIFPCPAPRHALADSEMITTPDGQQIRRKRRRRIEDGAKPLAAAAEPSMAEDQSRPAPAVLSDQHHPTRETPTAGSERGVAVGELDEQAAEFRRMEEEARRVERLARECPVPKPGGILGRVFGFSGGDNNNGRGRDGGQRDGIPGMGSKE